MIKCFDSVISGDDLGTSEGLLYCVILVMWRCGVKEGKITNQHWRPFPTPPHFHHKTCPAIIVLLYVSHLAESIYTSDPHPHECPRLLLPPPDTQAVLCAIIINSATAPHLRREPKPEELQLQSVHALG